jgi:predicted ATP-grasp superfamily ATP-dependent carboligase
MKVDAAANQPLRPAILLGVEHPQAYAAVRGLAVAGVPVEGVTQRPTWRLSASRYLNTVHHIGPRDEDVLAFLEQRRDRGGVIFPLTDEYMLLVSKNHEMLSRHYVLTTPPWATLKPIVDQRQLYVTAKGCGLNTPVFFTPRDEADMKRIVAGLDVENEAYLLKTFFDAGPANLDLNRFTVIPDMERESIEAESMRIFRRNGEFPMIAQVIPGGPEQSFGVTMLADRKSKPLFAFAVRRLKLFKSARGGHARTPFEVGANTQCETVDDPEAIEAATRLIKATGFVGPATIEFRRDPRNNRLILVKADPRLVGASSLASSLGLDLADGAYRLFAGLPLPAYPQPRPGVQWIWLSSYLDAIIRERSYRPMHSELMRGLGHLRRVRSMAYWDIRDPLPFVMDFLAWTWIRARALVRREEAPTA